MSKSHTCTFHITIICALLNSVKVRYVLFNKRGTKLHSCVKCHWFMCLGLGVLGFGEHFLYWSFQQWHFVIGVLPLDPVKLTSPKIQNTIR